MGSLYLWLHDISTRCTESRLHGYWSPYFAVSSVGFEGEFDLFSCCLFVSTTIYWSLFYLPPRKKDRGDLIARWVIWDAMIPSFLTLLLRNICESLWALALCRVVGTPIGVNNDQAALRENKWPGCFALFTDDLEVISGKLCKSELFFFCLLLNFVHVNLPLLDRLISVFSKRFICWCLFNASVLPF